MKILTKSETILNGLEKLNIKSSEELLNFLPYKYEDISYSDKSTFEDKEKVVLLGKLVSNPKHFIKNKLDIITFFFASTNGNIYSVKIFNHSYLMKILALGEIFSVIGIYDLKNKQVNASSVIKGFIDSNKIRSIYHLPIEINNTIFRKLMKKTFETYENQIIDFMPEDFKTKYRLLEKKEAIKKIHFPNQEKDISLALRTLKYHECLSYCLKNQIIRGENKRIPNIKKTKIDTKKINEFILSLSFKLTSDQVNAVREIILDMNKMELMYRLLQGDVGTGKTIVAAISLYGNYLRNKVGAFMVPTDSLARQQYEYFKNLFEKYEIKVGLLIGSLTIKEKNIIKSKLKDGEIDIIVGTHALFSNDVEYSSLGLAIIDEQHRFGVNQRNELIAKDDNCDLLLMSATPIPRTLSLSIYGDLDVSTLTAFPSAKRNVITKVVNETSYEIFLTINECIEENRQVFIVSNKIKGNNDSFSSAEAIYEKYVLLYKDNVKILHGKMKSEEKDDILKRFINKEFLILVSTTVIELGINVLDAGAIIIYDSNCFGLASLHQLRGRVGRNGKDAICLLVSDNIDDERLKFLENSNDGFAIAELDMKLRGPGDIVGFAQSGFPTFTCLNIIDDFKMFECARDDSYKIISNLNIGDYKRFYDNVLNDLYKESVLFE